jgi:hypothetical protein
VKYLQLSPILIWGFLLWICCRRDLDIEESAPVIGTARARPTAQAFASGAGSGWIITQPEVQHEFPCELELEPRKQFLGKYHVICRVTGRHRNIEATSDGIGTGVIYTDVANGNGADSVRLGPSGPTWEPFDTTMVGVVGPNDLGEIGSFKVIVGAPTGQIDLQSWSIIVQNVEVGR